jgi:6,7-dimethyl-8-ribityllumazine synthase
MSDDFPKPRKWDLSDAKIAVVAARFNESLVNTLIEKVSVALTQYGLKKESFFVERVPGSNEVPAAAAIMLDSVEFDCLIALGVVIKGGTDHHHLVGQSTSFALQDLSIQTRIPIINGIIVTESKDQAIERVNGETDRGFQFANAAAEMIELRRKWKNK